ncbi:MAG TPA: hypothetical protein VGO48_14075 [Conexibacter sp.]|nr:hypothetical protein [Conexibacter sp.]
MPALPAAVGDPIPDPDGGPPKPQTPGLAGNAWVGQTLAGTVGGWKDPTTEFSRRWVRCDASGGACTYIQRVGSTDPETGSTYVVRPGDLSYTLRMRVTAEVNGDIGDNGIDDHLPHAVEVDTAPSAVVTAPPGSGGGGAGGGGDTLKPVVTRLAMTHKRFAVSARATAVSARKRKRSTVPKGTAFTFRLSERATVLIAIDRLAPGRKAGGTCRRPTRANRRRAACRRAVRAGTLTRRGLPAGRGSIPFTSRIGRRRLLPGTYRATVMASDAAGNVSKAATVAFVVVRG